ncbi:iron uptake system component EfeO [Rhodobacter sp. JA431]|uniref:iron uptake system protein EfeO n=1 Tax=Rhodobacter sp. JA431 TaxID=570013 RepID=UPI000BD11D7D|nr:iron uptake system protein EfeO [Rhodobacter sp. JA431]SOB89766.1 iron uptake system component EfeO [Rhodobacter sp. JA431]
MKTLPLFAALLATTTAPALAEQAPLDLVGPIAEYKLYVSENTDILVEETRAFTEAVKAGEIEKAKALFAPTRLSYERIEPVAELFADLDAPIDARADDYEQAEADPEFTGFHRLEYALWVEGKTDHVTEIADKLQADIEELARRIDSLTFPPAVVVGGASVLMEEVAATKISGEEDRYSRTDLWDFHGNFDGAWKIVELFAPHVEDEAFLNSVEGNFDKVRDTLGKYREGEGFVSYEHLSDEDRRRLSALVNTLAEDLSTLRGRLGLI